MSLQAALAFASHGDWRRVVPAAREAVASEPDDAMAHALLALGLSHIEELREAVQAGRRAVALAPEMGFAQYAYGCALLENDDVNQAERAAREALRLDPGGDEHALLAQIAVRRGRWQEALEVAERGLQTSPEHGGCANLRSLALANLGRADEAMAGVHETLAQDPDDAHAHANRGWLMLRQSKPDEAMQSFGAALRLDPTQEWARLGMIEAMKARNLLYRGILRYSFWMASLSQRAQWFMIIGLYLAGRATRTALRDNPAWWPVLGPALGIYVLFVFGSWIADPLSNLVLRLHPQGRLALNRAERLASNVVGVCLLTAAIAFTAYVAAGWLPAMVLAAVSGLMLVPIGAVVNAYRTRAFRTLSIALGVLLVIGAAAVVASVANPDTSLTLMAIFVIGAVLFSWTATYMLSKQP